MKIVQIVTNLNIGDAIGNDAQAIDQALRSAGYTSEIMSITIHEELRSVGKDLDFRRIEPEDLVIFHKATGDPLAKRLAALSCRKVVLYHNITPWTFYRFYDPVLSLNLWRGRRQLKQLAKTADAGWADSAYNMREMAEAGFRQDSLSVLPILYDPISGEKPDETLLDRLRREKGTKLLFIGRVAPNKKQEDIIKVYHQFLRNEDPDAKLYLVGSWQGFEKYYAKLKGFAADLKLTEGQVIFTGRVSEAEKKSYLQGADALVCMSEHEGFCVPLLEAMANDLPVAAYAAAAVPETLGENGLLFREKNYTAIAKELGRLRRDESFRQSILEYQRERLRQFDPAKTEEKLMALIARVLEENV